MALKDIESLVTGKAQKEADGILASAKHRAKARLERANDTARTRHQQAVDTCTEELERHFEQQLTNLRADHNRELLDLKNRTLAEVYEKARFVIQHRPADKYPRWLAAQVRRATEIPGATISANPADSETISAEITRAGLDLRLGEADGTIVAGIVAHGKEFDLNLTADACLQEIWERVLPQFAAELFPAERGATGEKAK